MERSVKGREGKRWRRAAACGWRRRGVNRRPRGARARGVPGRAETAVGAAARPALQPQGVLSWALQRHGAGRAAGGLDGWPDASGRTGGAGLRGQLPGPNSEGPRGGRCLLGDVCPGQDFRPQCGRPPPLPRCLGRSGRWRPSPGTDEEQGHEGARPAWDRSPRPTLASCGTSVQHTHTHTEAGPPLTPQTPRSPTHTPGRPWTRPARLGWLGAGPDPPPGAGLAAWATCVSGRCPGRLPGRPPPRRTPPAPGRSSLTCFSSSLCPGQPALGLDSAQGHTGLTARVVGG